MRAQPHYGLQRDAKLAAWGSQAPENARERLKMKIKRFGALLAAGALALGLAGAAFAQGYPTPGQLGFQPAATDIAEEIHSFHTLILWIITAISLFVLALLGIVAFRFNEKANPVPSKTTHHAMLEVAWTVIPVMILVIIAIPSFRLLTHELTFPEADVTVKATGNTWYWAYEYPKDQGGGFGFDSNIKPDDKLDFAAGDMRLLSVDNELVLPVGKVVRMQVTAASGGMHGFVIPSFGVQISAVPGRLNEVWFKVNKEGVYYGECSNICGQNHAFMPIVARVVSADQYAQWLGEAKKKFASNEHTPIELAGDPVVSQQH